jgi:hypothetical protein
MDFDADPFMEEIEDAPVCLDCLLDEGLKKFFTEGFVSQAFANCHYCGQKNCITISSVSVQSLIRQHCLTEKNLAVQELGYCTAEGGYQGRTYESWELLEKAMDAVCDQLYHEMKQRLNVWETFCDNEHTLAPRSERWKSGWEELTTTIKHHTRFLFGQIGDLNPERNPDEPTPEEFLKNYIPTGLDKLDAIHTLPAKTKIYRCRETFTDESVTAFEHIGPLPPEYCFSPNRFSPPGISMLYAGKTTKISALEISWSNQAGKVLHTAELETRHDMNILDFTQLAYPRGKFDPQWIDQYHVADFFRAFIADLSKPSTADSTKHLDYVPTQMLCEYFRYYGATKDGIHYPISAIKYPSSHDGTPCYVFFCDDKQAAQWMNLLSLNKTLGSK